MARAGLRDRIRLLPEAAVDEALASPDTLREWSTAARRRIEEGFRIEDEAAALNGLYRELLEEEGEGR